MALRRRLVIFWHAMEPLAPSPTGRGRGVRVPSVSLKPLTL